jgi:hypothetical protein
MQLNGEGEMNLPKMLMEKPLLKTTISKAEKEIGG